MTDYIRNKQNKIKPTVDKNIAFYFGLSANTIGNYKKNDKPKYLELKTEFKKVWSEGKIK